MATVVLSQRDWCRPTPSFIFFVYLPLYKLYFTRCHCSIHPLVALAFFIYNIFFIIIYENALPSSLMKDQPRCFRFRRGPFSLYHIQNNIKIILYSVRTYKQMHIIYHYILFFFVLMSYFSALFFFLITF